MQKWLSVIVLLISFTTVSYAKHNVSKVYTFGDQNIFVTTTISDTSIIVKIETLKEVFLPSATGGFLISNYLPKSTYYFDNAFIPLSLGGCWKTKVIIDNPDTNSYQFYPAIKDTAITYSQKVTGDINSIELQYYVRYIHTDTKRNKRIWKKLRHEPIQKSVPINHWDPYPNKMPYTESNEYNCLYFTIPVE